MSSHTTSLPILVFPSSDRPLRGICQADGSGHLLEGGIMDREGLRPQMLHICSAFLSLHMHTNKRGCCASLFMLRKIKSGHLRQGEERMKQKQLRNHH